MMARLLDGFSNLAQWLVPALLIAWGDRRHTASGPPSGTRAQDGA